MATQRRFHLLGNLLHFHKFSSETENKYCLVEALVAPGAGAPLNRHPGEEESFVVLDGQFEFVLEDNIISAEAGEIVAIPSGAKHAFTNVGDTPGRLVIFNAPGQVHDKFFSEAGDVVSEETWELPTPGGAPDIPKVMTIASAAGVEIFPPSA